MKILTCVACRTVDSPLHFHNFWYAEIPTVDQIKEDIANRSMSEKVDYAIMGISRVTDREYTKITGLKWRSS